MGLFDKLRERFAPPATQGHTPGYAAPRGAGAPGRQSKDPDEAAVERYRYMLRTAPPETIEQAHAEAFAKLTPEQRRKVLADVSAELPPGERATSDDPRSLARMATRAEMRNPGTLERFESTFVDRDGFEIRRPALRRHWRRFRHGRVRRRVARSRAGRSEGRRLGFRLGCF